MSKEEAILRYKASMAVFKNWRTDGVIGDAELLEISAKLAQKYGLSSCSIYLENNLISGENRANMG